MYKLPGQEEILFYMLYAGAAVLSLIACCYLLLRRGNAFVPDITPPVRLRRWTAALFAAMSLSHMVYLPGIFLTSDDDILLCNLTGGLLDSMTVIPFAIIVLLCMLQDRKRPLWPVALIVAPLVVGLATCVVSRSDALLPMVHDYLMVMGCGFLIYMVREVRRYGRWLRDNYADLEHKEVWQSFSVQAAIVLLLGFYAFGISLGLLYEYIVQFICIVFICYFLWRVETLSDLNIPQSLAVQEETAVTGEQTSYDQIGSLLQQHCIDTQLYLQHDLTISQLAKAIGTNRSYLSQYFSRQDTTYNAYINNLRINHFVRLYREATAAQRSFTTKQLAHSSGYRSYSTFTLAFKQRMGKNVTAWISDSTE